MKVLALVLAVVAWVICVACTGSPTRPSTSEAATVRQQLDYDINIPIPAASLNSLYPQGVHMAPVSAQAAWDYTRTYGSPNVYYGETSPACEYTRAGIVVAPRSVASKPTFTAKDWPGIGLDPAAEYEWVGRFTYVPVPDPGSYHPDPSAKCNTPK